MLLTHSLPAFCIGEWVEINESCLINQYIGKIVQIVEVAEPTTDYRRFEYVCKIQDHLEQIFWEHELSISKVIPISGVFKDAIKGKADVKKPEEKEEEEPKVIWV